MYAKKNRIGEPAILPGYIFHRVTVSKTKMHILIHTHPLVGFVAPIIPPGGRNDDIAILQGDKRP